MDWTTVKVACLILKHHGVSACIVGELALNYYNVPRVCHDVQICVPKLSSAVAAGILCSTGLFEPFEHEQNAEFNNYAQYKQGLPHLLTIIIFSASFFGLDPIKEVLVQPFADRDVYISKETQGLSRDDLTHLRLPRLAPLIGGLAKRYLDTRDDVSMIALEQLVDGMNPDESWVQQYLEGAEPAVRALVMDLVRDKKSRIDYFSDNQVTCFIKDEKEAANQERRLAQPTPCGSQKDG
ncbi:ser/Thr protein phosphatase [Chaetomium strumarium]|uniref:Ser/Thr protein phosphatase n=1 Tax=Chaetomium strumarium TaxID=1170767 RepID=A0AAJ0GPJ6_9PEZI|nr:ser/Thr protein phosphatase [Chaetomium strumarium]